MSAPRTSTAVSDPCHWQMAWMELTTWGRTELYCAGFVHGAPDNSRLISVPMPSEHSLASVASAMVVGSTRPDPTRTAEETAAGLAPTSLNTATHCKDRPVAPDTAESSCQQSC